MEIRTDLPEISSEICFCWLQDDPVFQEEKESLFIKENELVFSLGHFLANKDWHSKKARFGARSP